MSINSSKSYFPDQNSINYNGICLVLDKALKQLRDNCYLDDLILDFFMEFTKESCVEACKSNATGKYYVFSSLFYTILSMCGEDEEYLRLRKWIKRVSTPLLLNDAIVIPMYCSQTSHWWLIIICHPYKVFNLLISSLQKTSSSTKIEESDRGWIICMDSLGGKNIGQQEKRKAIIKILKFLDIERRNNNCYMNPIDSGYESTITDSVNTANTVNATNNQDKLSFAFRSLSNWEIIYNPKNLPFQENNFDCGIYIIEYSHWLFHSGTTIFNSMINTNLNTEASLSTCLCQNIFSKKWFQNRRAVYIKVLKFMSTNTHWSEDIFLRNRLVEIFDDNLYNTNQNEKVTQEHIPSLQNRRRFVMSSLNKSYFNK